MERNDEQQHGDVIDLGAIVEETKGPSGDRDDFVGGLRQTIGLTDE
ncbi:benenodin family lasso peptide [Sphingobium sp. H39-3-25]|nr:MULTISPECIES: benenodin family lasso peptide [Sphingomonadaceae]MDF0491131.1 benenodin family lasso peptide [Sphingomonas pollutisoli]MDF0545137.1 benenodin family lasso peptide [Sphingobium arseniciresistens]